MNPQALLHICCGPDATAVFERLQSRYQVTGYFHNPNIQPESEYHKRLVAAQTVAARMGFPLLDETYKPEGWCRAVRGLEAEKEKGARCRVCFLFNLRATAAKAKALGMSAFTTTLTISPHKIASHVFQAGAQAAEEAGVVFLAEDFKKQHGFQRSLALSREFGVYRQNYCGCAHSLRVGE